MKVGVVIAAAGSGRRMGAEENKVFLPIRGKPVISHSLELFAALEEVEEIVVVTRKADLKAMQVLAGKAAKGKSVQVAAGGQERQDSVYIGLKALPPNTDLVVIHDGARPYLTEDLVRRALEGAEQYGAVGAAVPVTDTIKQVQGNIVLKTLPRDQLWAVQTPQAFAYDLILAAHREAQEKGLSATDDCALLERLGHSVRIVRGDYKNIKITTPEDLPDQDTFFVGFGWDVHRLAENRALILGGVEIPFTKGLLGHSDADVVVHALMDAILGAMGKGDIGELFPDTDPAYAGISSLTLLAKVMEIVNRENLSINNLDITIMAQKPKLAPFKDLMRAKLAQATGADEHRINIKATTAEGLGFVGREEGIAAQAAVSLRPK